MNEAPPELCDLYPEVVEYGRVLARRAETMVFKLQGKMGELGAEVACVVASGPLLDLVCDSLRAQGISYTWIDPAGGAGDLRDYEQRLLDHAPGGTDSAMDA